MDLTKFVLLAFFIDLRCLATDTPTPSSCDFMPHDSIEYPVMDTCNPCDHTRVKRNSNTGHRSNYSRIFIVEGIRVLRALRGLSRQFHITDMNHQIFNLQECCGYPAYIYTSRLPQMNKAEIVATMMLLLKDVVTLDKTRNVIRSLSVRNLKNTLCSMESVGESQREGSCLNMSPLSLCCRGNTCDNRITFSFLKSAFQMLQYLIRSSL